MPPKKADSRERIIAETLEKLVIGMGLEYERVRVEPIEANVLRVNLDTPEASLLLGHEKEGLFSLQYLLRVALWKSISDETPIVVLDINYYRKSQEENVQKMADEMAKRVIKTGKPVILPPMEADKRRLVHTYIAKNYPKLKTESADEGQDRFVKIYPPEK